MAPGRDFVSRTGNLRLPLATIARYVPIIGDNQWADNLLTMRPDIDEEGANGPSTTPVSAPVIVGGSSGTVAGSIIYGGTNHWAIPFWNSA